MRRDRRRCVAGLMAATAGFTTSRTQKPRPIQKAPKVPKPVAPTTFLLRNSHMAAHSWANPPYAKSKAEPRVAGGMGHPAGVLGGQQERSEGKGGQPERGWVGNARNGGRSGRAGLDCAVFADAQIDPS